MKNVIISVLAAGTLAIGIAGSAIAATDLGVPSATHVQRDANLQDARMGRRHICLRWNRRHTTCIRWGWRRYK